MSRGRAELLVVALLGLVVLSAVGFVVAYLSGANTQALGLTAGLAFAAASAAAIVAGASVVKALPSTEERPEYSYGEEPTAAYEPTPQNDAPVNQWHKKVRQVCRDKKIRLETIAEGQVFTLDGVRVDVLAPAKIALATPPTGANNALILRVRWRKTTFLLAGGVSQAGENALLSRPADLQADVLRVARMGDKSATSPELLRRVNPHFFVISAASAPQAGSKEAGGETYPHEETIKRLQAVGAPIWQTGTAPLTFVSDGTKISPPDTPPLLIQ